MPWNATSCLVKPPLKRDEQLNDSTTAFQNVRVHVQFVVQTLGDHEAVLRVAKAFKQDVLLVDSASVTTGRTSSS